jgi:hypothetical protein
MTSRQMLGVAIVCSAMGTLGGQTVRAATPNSARFVQLLLLNQAAAIQADTKALNTLNQDIAKFETLTNRRKIKSLGMTISRLNSKILNMTAKLGLLSAQNYTTAVNLNPANPGLVNKALIGLLAVQKLSVQVGFGITPATPSQ